MSGTFYTQVSRLFHLLDLDGNHRIDREECRLGFNACFSDVHRTAESIGNKESILNSQVSWLFSAAAATEVEHEALDEIDEDKFKGCYQKLLAAAYEEEVLALDLHRAIESLTNSSDWQLALATFKALSQLFETPTTIELDANTGHLTPESNSAHRAILEAIFLPITGRSNLMGPRTQTQARKMVTPIMAQKNVSIDDIRRVFKALLAIPVPPAVLKAGVEGALQAASGTVPSSSSSSSSSSTN